MNHCCLKLLLIACYPCLDLHKEHPQKGEGIGDERERWEKEGINKMYSIEHLNFSRVTFEGVTTVYKSTILIISNKIPEFNTIYLYLLFAQKF